MEDWRIKEDDRMKYGRMEEARGIKKHGSIRALPGLRHLSAHRRGYLFAYASLWISCRQVDIIWRQ